MYTWQNGIVADVPPLPPTGGGRRFCHSFRENIKMKVKLLERDGERFILSGCKMKNIMRILEKAVHKTLKSTLVHTISADSNTAPLGTVSPNEGRRTRRL